MSSLPVGIDWKNPHDVRRWKDAFYAQFERDRASKKKPQSVVLAAPLLSGVPLTADMERARRALDEFAIGHELVQWEGETELARLKRLEGKGQKPSKRTPSQIKHTVPRFLGIDSAGWLIHPILKRQDGAKLDKARTMYESNRELDAKAQRQAACGILGGEVHCIEGHHFFAAYECGCRFCPTCGPLEANKLFARQHDRVLFVAQGLMLCGAEDCSECNRAIEEKKLPHWPPPTGSSPRIVCAKLDFTVRTQNKLPPTPETMRMLNSCIKKFARAFEKRAVFNRAGRLIGFTDDVKRFRRWVKKGITRGRWTIGVSRKKYGLAYCDELGGNNNNPHAHGIYVGPWLPNDKKELAALWQKVTEKEFPGTFIISVKYARNFSEALYHAVKYPAKFAERSSANRLAELEGVFHDVRRFHTMCAFYNPEAPPNPEPAPKCCPLCSLTGKISPLTDWYKWEGVLEMRARGLRDLRTVTREANDARANAPP